MAIEFLCPHCNATIKTSDQSAGKKGTCRKCQSELVVPLLVWAAPDESPSPLTEPAGNHEAPTATSIPVAVPVTDQWFVARNGQQVCVVDSAMLRQLAQTGHVLPTDLLCQHGQGGWYLASTIAGLFAPNAAPTNVSIGLSSASVFDSAALQTEQSDSLNREGGSGGIGGLLVVFAVIAIVLILAFNNGSDHKGLMVLVLIAVSIPIYFAPSSVAVQRDHKHQTAIVALNLFLGWSFVGWVVALVWALTNSDDATRQRDT